MSAKMWFCLFEIHCLLPFPLQRKIETIPLSDGVGSPFLLKVVDWTRTLLHKSLGIIVVAKETLN